MHPPVDYPVHDEASALPSLDDMTYAALLARYDSELLITEDMIQCACTRMETAQQFPFATRAEPVVATQAPVLTRLINAIR